MKFAIFNEIEEGGKKKRKILVEWESERIIEELLIAFDKFDDVAKAFDAIIEKFKRESIKIP